MESKQNSFMVERKKIEDIRNIVEMVTGERTISVTRYRGEVEARSIFAALLNDMGIHVESIALTMKKSRYAAKYYINKCYDLIEIDPSFRDLHRKCKTLVDANKFKDERVDSYNIVGRLVQENEALKQEIRLLKERMKPIYTFITEKEWMEESKKKETGQPG